MLLSRTIVLLTFRGALAAAEDTDPESKLLVSLASDMFLIELIEIWSEFVVFAFLVLGAII
jgi:hypothetical protein